LGNALSFGPICPFWPEDICRSQDWQHGQHIDSMRYQESNASFENPMEFIWVLLKIFHIPLGYDFCFRLFKGKDIQAGKLQNSKIHIEGTK
jgi:hypothetical protein